MRLAEHTYSDVGAAALHHCPAVQPELHPLLLLLLPVERMVSNPGCRRAAAAVGVCRSKLCRLSRSFCVCCCAAVASSMWPTPWAAHEHQLCCTPGHCLHTARHSTTHDCTAHYCTAQHNMAQSAQQPGTNPVLSASPLMNCCCCQVILGHLVDLVDAEAAMH